MQQKPNWQTTDGSIQLYHGDCLEILPTFADNSIDCVITDPVWPNAISCLAGSNNPFGLMRDCAAFFPSLAKRCVIHVGCDSDPRFLLAIPEEMQFLRVCWLRYARPSYKGRILVGSEVAYVLRRLYMCPGKTCPGYIQVTSNRVQQKEITKECQTMSVVEEVKAAVLAVLKSQNWDVSETWLMDSTVSCGYVYRIVLPFIERLESELAEAKQQASYVMAANYRDACAAAEERCKELEHQLASHQPDRFTRLLKLRNQLANLLDDSVVFTIDNDGECAWTIGTIYTRRDWICKPDRAIDEGEWLLENARPKHPTAEEAEAAAKAAISGNQEAWKIVDEYRKAMKGT